MIQSHADTHSYSCDIWCKEKVEQDDTAREVRETFNRKESVVTDVSQESVQQ